MIQQTSIEAYKDIVDDLGPRQTEVLNALEELKSANNRQISQYLRLPINSITGRVKELRNRKRVGVDKVALDPITNKNTIYWKPTKLKE